VVVRDLAALGIVAANGASDDGGSGSSDTFFAKFRDGWRWQWEESSSDHQRRRPLRIIAHAGGEANAVYHRGRQALKFNFHTDAALRARVYACRSFDMVSHETGHAILDSLCPLWYQFKGSGESAALHEGFADCVALFTMLDLRGVRESAVLALVKHRLDAMWADEGEAKKGWGASACHATVSSRSVDEGEEDCEDATEFLARMLSKKKTMFYVMAVLMMMMMMMMMV